MIISLELKIVGDDRVYVVKFFKVIGLAPYKLTILPSPQNKLNGQQFLGQTSYSLLGLIYNLVLPLTSIPTLYYWLPQVHKKTESSDTEMQMEAWREFFFGVTSHGTFIIIVLFCIVKQRVFIKVINRLFQFEKELADTFYNTKNLPSGKPILIFVFSTHLSATVLNILTEFFAELKYITALDTVLFIIPEFVIGNLVIQYALILIFLENRFKGLNKLLLSLVDTNCNESKCQRFFRIMSDSCNENVVRLIRYIRDAQRNLYEISDDFSKCYSWPMLLSITYFAAGIIYSSYELFQNITKSETNILVSINLALWVIKTMIPIVTLTCCVTKIINEVTLKFFIFLLVNKRHYKKCFLMRPCMAIIHI
ncbi:uncharacterized protein LOC141531451 [Cotesia typhae]|uniref:uncharacterized protein LOC141531451 n=1 Tax=Cotesia typhae TaxID=2053667 RepID=UPI003D68B3D3